MSHPRCHTPDVTPQMSHPRCHKTPRLSHTPFVTACFALHILRDYVVHNQLTNTLLHSTQPTHKHDSDSRRLDLESCFFYSPTHPVFPICRTPSPPYVRNQFFFSLFFSSSCLGRLRRPFERGKSHTHPCLLDASLLFAPILHSPFVSPVFHHGSPPPCFAALFSAFDHRHSVFAIVRTGRAPASASPLRTASYVGAEP